MSTHKYFDRICIVILVITLAVTVLFINGKNLGLASVIDEDAESYEGDANFTSNDYNGTWEKQDAVKITLNGDSATVRGNGAYFYDNRLVIAGGGYYEVTGELTEGQIVVDAYSSSKVFIKLMGVNIYCPDDAALRVDQADKVFLTLMEGTINNLESGEEYSDEALEEGSKGVIFTHDDLTINGSGSLTITGSYQHGIDANDDLVITGGMLEVTAPTDAFHVNDAFKFTGADLTIHAGDDAIHADKSILVAGGSILIDECYEGLEALTIDMQDGSVEIYPSDDAFNANGGSESFFGGFQEGGRDAFSNTEVAEASTETGAKNDMFSRGREVSENETLSEASDEEECWVHISGGEVTIVNSNGRDADGIDSNGDIQITGGTVHVSLNGDGSNNALDYGSESGGILEINGGTVIACGGSSMVESVSETSSQYSLLYNFDDITEDQTYVSLVDEAGKELAGWEVPCGFTSVTLSCPGIEAGKTYLLKVGDTETEAVFESTTLTIGTTAGGMGGFGNMGGAGGNHGMGGHRNQSSTGNGGSPQPDGSTENNEGMLPGGDFSQSEMSMGHGGFTPPDMSTESSFAPSNMSPGQGGMGMQGGFGGPGGQQAQVEQETITVKGTPISELSTEVWIWLTASVTALVLVWVIILLTRKLRK